MGLFVGNPFTGSNGWIKQPVTQEQRIKMMELEALRKRKNSNGGLDNYRDAVAKIGETEAALKGMKDQSRLGGLPPGPLPPEGDTTVVEKGAGPQPIALPQGVAMGSEQPFKQVPPDRFQEPIQDPVLTADAIRQSYGRQQQMMAQNGAPTPPERPDVPLQVATTSVRPPPQEKRGTPAPPLNHVTPPAAGNDLAGGIQMAANELGIDPLDLATAISYETAGTFDPTKRGPRTQWGRHRGLIQWGEPQAQKYLGGDFSVPAQMKGIVSYLKDTGVQPGMGLMDIYSAINAGGVGRYDASDANNGGAPGTVADKVNNQMADHRKKAVALLGGEFAPETDGDWISGGETAVAGASPAQGASPSPALAFAQEPNMNSPAPQEALMKALLSMQGAQNYAPAPHTPMLPGSPQSELAQTAPIVAGGGNVNPISFGGDMPASPEQTDQRKALAEAMLASSQGTQDIRHPTQGLAQVARAATGAYGMHRANKQEDEYRQRLAQALIGSQNGGSADELAQLNPRMYMQIQQQRAAQEAQQAQIQRQDALRQQEWQREDALRQQEWQREDAIRQEKEAAARFGTIPTGWQTVQDGGAMRLEPIPGGPAEREMQQASEQEQLRERVKAMGGGIVSEDIGRAYDMVRESPNWRTGAAGSLLQHAPGTGAHNLSKTLQTVRANTAFDALQRMREASPTGGALGAVSERELAALESTQGALEQSQTADQLAYNLARLNDTTLDIIHGPSWRETNPELSMMGRFQQDFGKEDDGAPPKAGQVEDGYRFKGGDPSNPNNWERL